MLRTLRAALALLCLAELASSRPQRDTSYKVTLSEIIRNIQNLNSRVRVPCNDTRVAQVAFTNRELLEDELLCQATTVLTKVTRCKEEYKPLITNLQSLHGKASCSLNTDNEIYLINFLPALGNFTQTLYRRLWTTAAN